MIVEIAGRPAEYVKDILKVHVGKIKEAKDASVVCEKLSEPKKLDSEQEMYTCFAEIEIETSSLSRLLELIFDYMPSSVEIVEPSELRLNSQEATAFACDLAGRLHKYDEIAKIAQIQTQQLAQKLQIMQQEYMKLSNKKGEKNDTKSEKAKKKEKKKPLKKKKN